MSRADYLGKQFFKIAQLTNSSICYKNTFRAPEWRQGTANNFVAAARFEIVCHELPQNPGQLLVLSLLPPEEQGVSEGPWGLVTGTLEVRSGLKTTLMLHMKCFGRTILFLSLTPSRLSECPSPWGTKGLQPHLRVALTQAHRSPPPAG